jgi:hypothetical protein
MHVKYITNFKFYMPNDNSHADFSPGKNSDSDLPDYSKYWDIYPHSHLIRATKKYKVFINMEGHLDWVTTPEFDIENEKLPQNIQSRKNVVFGRITIAEAAPCEAMSEAVKRHFISMLGEACVCNIEAEFAAADKMIEAALHFQRIRKEELSRSWYLIAAAKAAAFYCVCAIVIWLLRDWFIKVFSNTALDMVMYAVTGALGALLSVIVRSGKIKFDPSSGRPLHVLEASSRICAGALSAIVVILAVKSGLILSALVNATNLPYVLFLAAAGAGSVERYATSIISRFESLSNDSSTSEKPH